MHYETTQARTHENSKAALYFGDHFYDHYPPNDPFERGAWSQREAESSDGLSFDKGPKGYQRSDESIGDEVNDALTRNAYLDASDIEVRVENSIVTLSGTVANRQMKVLAEDCIESISGIQDIHNKISLSVGL
jgi:osmotically-inducible protein OsmY